MRIPVINGVSITLRGAPPSFTAPEAVSRAKLASLQDGDTPPSTSITSIDPNVNVKKNLHEDVQDPKLKEAISVEILDFFTSDAETATQAPQLPAALQSQYSADLDSLIEQIQLDTDETVLKYLSGQLDAIESKEILIELSDPSPDESAQLLQTRYQVLCNQLGLETAISNVTTPAITMTTTLQKITFHTFQSNGEVRNYFWKLLQRLTTH